MTEHEESRVFIILEKAVGWAWETNVKVACDGNFQVSGLIFSSRIGPSYVFLLSLFSWLSPSYLLWRLNFLSFLIHDYQLHFCLPYPSIIPLMYEKDSPILAQARTQIFQMIHTPFICPFAKAFKSGGLFFCFDHLPPKINKTADIPKFRHSSLTSLLLTDVISPGPTWPASLAWFIGDGSNNYRVMRERVTLRKSKEMR